MLRTIKMRKREGKREREREREREFLWRLKKTHIISFGITRYNAQCMCPVY